MPTDLGTPAVVETLIPTLHDTNMNIVKTVVNKVINIHVDNRFRVWRHSRIGLRFYNPLVDIWQGIERFHSVDVVLPLLMDVTINTQQQSMKISWKRHTDEKKNIMGVRNHVTNMVFVKDDLKHDVLKKSCANCEKAISVSKGRELRDNVSQTFYLFTHYKFIQVYFIEKLKKKRVKLFQIINSTFLKDKEIIVIPIEMKCLAKITTKRC